MSANSAQKYSQSTESLFLKLSIVYTGWPKKVSHYQMIKNRIKSYQSPWM